MNTRRLLGSLLAVPLAFAVTYLGWCALWLAAYSVVLPPTTGVQTQRRIEAWISGADYDKDYRPVARARINAHLAHAVIAAEDGRFYIHGGIDWKAVRKAIEDNRRRGRAWRGGSTITQQLVKNLFMTTRSSLARKAFEVPLAYAAEIILSKERILTLYLNVIEWGPGVYGAEAAAQHHFGTSAKRLSRRQSAQLAAVIPSPRARTPQRMGTYTRTIERRMRQLGW